ncbi:MAG: ATP-dependent DNA helicase RecQ, partial [Burkholderiales bacterium]|nr:ATP-dependent DNA helicase RecQ [Burkholderiales bacterium]
MQSTAGDDAALRLLQQVFKLPGFRPGQEQVIEALLAGRSALAIFPTGGGKSLCYQLPALLFDGLTLVVSPLIALMKDQVDALAKLGVRAARLDSSLSAEAVRDVYRGIEQGDIKLLYVSPERLKNERFVARLRDPRMRISLLAIDEAHCISEWGHNFRPDYLKLGSLAQSLRVERVLALTATATPAVAADICRQFGIVPGDHVQTSFRRPNLHLRVTLCGGRERLEILRSRIARQAHGAATIVYVTLQETAEQVAEALQAAGHAAAHYHAGMDDEARTRVQDDFMAGHLSIVVATIAFGMGIDKADIRAVYHYNLPKSIENYVQEIGRAGRDGLVSHCEMLVCVDDRLTLENFVYGDTPTRESLHALLAAIDAFDEVFDVTAYELSTPFDIRPLVANTALTYLELEGVIAATSPSYAEYKVAFKVPRDEVCARFEGERREFLESLFDASRAGRKWLTVNLADVTERFAQPRERILKALNYLEEQDLIELQAAGLRQGYRKPGARQAASLLDRMAGLF